MKRALPFISLAGRLAAGAMLTVAGFLKLRAPAQEFAAALEAYRFFPEAFLTPASQVLPWVEYLLGVFLLAGLWLRRTAPAALALFGGFVTVLGVSLARGIDLSGCGCFGSAWPLSPAATLVADSVAVLLLAAVVLDREQAWSLDRRLKR